MSKYEASALFCFIVFVMEDLTSYTLAKDKVVAYIYYLANLNLFILYTGIYLLCIVAFWDVGTIERNHQLFINFVQT